MKYKHASFHLSAYFSLVLNIVQHKKVILSLLHDFMISKCIILLKQMTIPTLNNLIISHILTSQTRLVKVNL